MSPTRGNGWFWSWFEHDKYTDLEQTRLHELFSQSEYQMLKSADIDRYLSPDSEIGENLTLPIFRNRWRLDDKLKEFTLRLHILSNPEYITHLRLDAQSVIRTKYTNDLKFACFLLRARLKLDIFENKHPNIGLGWRRQRQILSWRKKLDEYNRLIKDLSGEFTELELVVKPNIITIPALPMLIQSSDIVSLELVWKRGLLKEILSIMGQAHGPGMDALQAYAPYASTQSYLFPACNGCLRLIDDLSQWHGVKDHVGFWESLAYYVDESKDIYVNDLICWAPGNFITSGALHIIDAATAGLINLGLLVVDVGMSWNRWREARAYYLNESQRINDKIKSISDDLTLKPEQQAEQTSILNRQLADLVLTNKHDWERAKLNMFYAFLLVIALAILCVALCYAGLPIAAVATLSIICSAISFAVVFLRSTSEHMLYVSHQNELKAQLFTSDDTQLSEYQAQEQAMQIQHHDDLIAYRTKLYAVNMGVLICTCVCSLLILSLAAWPVSLMIIAIILTGLVIQTLKYQYLKASEALTAPEIKEYGIIPPLADDLQDDKNYSGDIEMTILKRDT